MYFPRKQPPLNIFFLVFTDTVVRNFQFGLQARVVGEEAEVGISPPVRSTDRIDGSGTLSCGAVVGRFN
jgi:hypothetical protein